MKASYVLVGLLPTALGLIPERIDTHSHFVPPVYHNASIAAGFGVPDGFPLPVGIRRLSSCIVS